MLQDYYQKATKRQILLAKLLVGYGFVLITLYMLFRAFYIRFGLPFLPFSILLYLAEFHTIILMYGFLYSLWPRKYKKYYAENRRRDLAINMFITVAGEPAEVVENTIKHAKAAADYYTHKIHPVKPPRVAVLNDGKAAGKANWYEIKLLADKYGVEHVARETNEGFKAGNINNALQVFPAEDTHNTIDVFFDSDFAAKPHFLIEILKPLRDDEVDFVQSPQRYHNLDTWVAKGAGAHQIFFFDYMCPAKAHDNALFLCGTNYAIRRKALLAAGGVDKRFVTEDYATSIKLHLNGNRGVFVPDILATGMAPMNLKEYFNQQTRWCKGCLDANGQYLKELFFGKLTWQQKWHYFLSTAYYFIGVRDLILVLAPIPYLFFGTSLIRANSIEYLGFIYLPLIIFNFILFFSTFRNPLKSLVLDIVAFPVFAKAFLSSVVGVNLPFSITIKKYERENVFRVYSIQLLVALILISGLVYSFVFNNTENIGSYINYFWATYSASFLVLGFWLVIRENYQFKFELSQNMRRTLNYAKYAFMLLIAYGIGLSAPLAYTVVSKTPEHIISAAPVQNALETVNLDTKEELLIPAKSIYYGYYNPVYNEHPTEFEVGVVEGEQPSLAMFYEDWNEDSQFNIAFMNRMSNRGVVPIVTWEPIDTQNPDSELNTNGNPTRLITSGKYDKYIRDWAIRAKRYRKPFFLRFAHEMNGNWYPWGDVEPFADEAYKDMWIHVHNIFEEVGADNVIWVWSPNNTNHYGETENVLDFYPGDEYVDWVAYSAFNWGDVNHNKPLWRKFDYMSFYIYEKLSTLDKPIMVAETSSVSKGGDKEFWFRQTLGEDIPYMDKIKAVIIFNEDYGRADFDISSYSGYKVVFEDVIRNNPYYSKSPLLIKK